jgi:hypothetical protein
VRQPGPSGAPGRGQDGAEAGRRLSAGPALLRTGRRLHDASDVDGLTFGTITSLYGLQAGIIDRTQFSLLLTVIILSAVVPTAIAQRVFQPSPVEVEARRAVR